MVVRTLWVSQRGILNSVNCNVGLIAPQSQSLLRQQSYPTHGGGGVASLWSAQAAIVSKAAIAILHTVHLVGVQMEIGQKVRLRRLRDRSSAEVVKRLGQTGIIQAFKMVDGSGVGVVVQFDDKFSTWFFEDEIELLKA
jgi:Protein of unknown function (DUF2862)